MLDLLANIVIIGIKLWIGIWVFILVSYGIGGVLGWDK